MPGLLSVSPIGSSPLQQTLLERMLEECRSFSIPNRIEPSATLGVSVETINRRLTFSIPNRIEPSATWWEEDWDLCVFLFQYPQSDRALCNGVGAVVFV